MPDKAGMTKVRLCPTTSTPSKPAIPPRARQDLFARLPAQIARAMTRARLGEASRRRRSEIRHQPRGAREAAAAAQIRAARPAEGNPAVRRLQRHRARQGEAAVHVAGADLRARGPRQGLQRARARCSRPASAPATSCTTASRITSRPARSFWKPARTRSAARSFPAASATPRRSSTRSRSSSPRPMSARRTS